MSPFTRLLTISGGEESHGAEAFELIEWSIKYRPERLPKLWLSSKPVHKKHSRYVWHTSGRGFAVGVDTERRLEITGFELVTRRHRLNDR